MAKSMQRISLLLRKDQYQKVLEAELNLSGLVRDLIDDHFSEHKIVLGVSEETSRLYDQVVSNTGSTDEDIEKYLRAALKTLLQDKIQEMELLQKGI